MIIPSQSTALEETKRTARILELVQMIAVAPRRYTRAMLAEHFEISERMISKDLEVIRNALRLSLQRHDRQGGYYFENVPHLPAVQYTFTEGLALLIAVQMAAQLHGAGSPELAAAMARLEALFPDAFVPFLRHDLFRFTATGQERRQDLLTFLNQALILRRKIEVRYRTRSRDDDETVRVLHPYYLKLYVRSWQLIAYCEHRQRVLMFKIDRVATASLLPERYIIPDDFSPETYMGSTWGMMRGNATPPVDVVLQFDRDAGQWVSEEFWHSSQQFEPQPDGTMLVRLHIALTPEFINWLQYYGKRVRVVEPDHLRVQLVEAYQAAIVINS